MIHTEGMAIEQSDPRQEFLHKAENAVMGLFFAAAGFDDWWCGLSASRQADIRTQIRWKIGTALNEVLNRMMEEFEDPAPVNVPDDLMENLEDWLREFQGNRHPFSLTLGRLLGILREAPKSGGTIDVTYFLEKKKPIDSNLPYRIIDEVIKRVVLKKMETKDDELPEFRLWPELVETVKAITKLIQEEA